MAAAQWCTRLLLRAQFQLPWGFDQGHYREVVLPVTPSLVISRASGQRGATLLEKSVDSLLCGAVLAASIAARSPMPKTDAEHGGLGKAIKDGATNPLPFAAMGTCIH